MLFSLFEGEDWPWWLPSLIAEIRAEHLASGGDPADFSQYLRDQGIKMDGPVLTIANKWKTYMELKHENKNERA